MNTTDRGVRWVIVSLAVAMPIAAQAPTWSTVRQHLSRSTCAAYDVGRQRLVMVEVEPLNPSFSATWELDGADPTGRWRRLDWPFVCTFNQPAMVYDQARRELVLLDGATTWCSDGTGWQQRNPAVSPPTRNRHAMSYDSGRNVVVLFGGRTPSSNQLDDTWEWNGVTWQQIATPVRPAARESALMAYDPLQQRTVLIGGYGPMYLYDTWHWDGIAWQQQASPPPPIPSSLYTAMAWFPPRNRMTVNDISGTREWDGTSWVSVAYPSPEPWPMCYAPDQQRLLLCQPGVSSTPETWEWNGMQWSRRGAQRIATVPWARIDPAIATDPARGNVVIFGGHDSALAYVQVFDDTWVWQQRRWQRRTPATSPSARRGAAMAYHPSTQRLVLFGGSSGQPSNDTWTWDGANWTQQQPANNPPPRQNAGMATDALRDRVVLFGGTVPVGQPYNDTWEWDGSNWLQRFPAQSPPAGSEEPAMAYHTASQRVVLTKNNTWVYDGTNWQAIAAPNSPPAGGFLAEDPDRGVLLWSGAGNQHNWEWDGATWTLSSTGGTYGPMAFDPDTRRCLAFAQLTGFASNFMRLYGPPQDATTTSLGSGCAGSTAPKLTTNLLWLQETRMLTDLVGAPAQALCVFALSTQQQPLSLGSGCTLYPANPILDWRLANSAGFASISFDLPPGLPLGTTVFAQGAVLDAAAPLGFALTAGRQVALGL